MGDLAFAKFPNALQPRQSSLQHSSFLVYGSIAAVVIHHTDRPRPIEYSSERLPFEKFTGGRILDDKINTELVAESH
jgi:hypothetical protein